MEEHNNANAAAAIIGAEYVSQEHILKMKEELLAAIHQHEENYSWVFAILLFAVIVAGITVLKRFLIDWLSKQSKKSDTKIDDAFFDIINKWTRAYVVISFAAFVATATYPVAESFDLLSKVTFLGIATFKLLSSLEFSISFVAEEYVFDKNDKENVNVFQNFRKALRLFLYGAGVIFICDNIGLNISSVVAGLGLGGLAVALAAQAVLGDALASVALFMDQPFKVGDAVTTLGFSGVIESIGFKTVKVRANSGELVVLPNSAVSSSNIQNFSRSTGGRLNQDTIVKVNVGTSTEDLQRIPHLLFQALSGHEEFEPKEIYLVGFGDYSINFDVRYSVARASPVTCRHALGMINQIVVKTFREHNIVAPYPKSYVTNVDPQHH